MISFDNPTGQRVLERLASEQVIWLTTVSPSGSPQPRPVWFIWDGAAIIVYTEATAYKVLHIASNPRVAVNFNSDSDGGDIQVILGVAHVDSTQPLVTANEHFVSKYRDGIRAIGLDEPTFAQQFDTALRIEPMRMRGLDPLPET